MKKLLTICAILIASLSYSQEYIQITTEQAKEAIKARQRVEVLEVAIRKQSVIITELQIQVENLKEQVASLTSQIALKDELYSILETRYNAEKEIKNPGYSWGDFLIDAVIGLGAAVVTFISAGL